jgi:hypothetical protein
MKSCEGVDIHIHVFLASEHVEGEWSASHLDRSTLWEEAARVYWIGSWVGSRVCLENIGKGKCLTLTGLKGYLCTSVKIATRQ